MNSASTSLTLPGFRGVSHSARASPVSRRSRASTPSHGLKMLPMRGQDPVGARLGGLESVANASPHAGIAQHHLRRRIDPDRAVGSEAEQRVERYRQLRRLSKVRMTWPPGTGAALPKASRSAARPAIR